MRISDERYNRDRLRLDLAMRFIRHGARTHTVHNWTGLSDDRVRRLCLTYVQEPGREAVVRPRGKSPRQPAFFLRKQNIQLETAILSGLYCIFGVLPPPRPGGSRGIESIHRGELLCRAYEAYLRLVSDAHISFEYAVFLLVTLARGDELRLVSCVECGCLKVVDRLTLHEPRCEHCGKAVEPIAPCTPEAVLRRLPLARFAELLAGKQSESEPEAPEDTVAGKEPPMG
jgi:hypothetical protein